MSAGHLVAVRDKIERAYRNGERLHLDVEQVRALVGSPLFGLLAELVAEEFKEECAKVEPRIPREPTTGPGRSSSDRSASSGEKIALSGLSLGTMTAEQEELVASAERRRALAAVEKAGGRRRRH